MKLTWNEAAGVLHLDADVADPVDLRFMELVWMQHGEAAAPLAALARAKINRRYTACDAPVGDPAGCYMRGGLVGADEGFTDADGWRVFTGFDLPLARLGFSAPTTPAQQLRAASAARLGHGVLDALELVIREPH